MLYVTTRISGDAFTAYRAMSENRGPEGGFYVPMRLPEFDRQAINSLAEKSFAQNVAQILNLFFGTKLDSWDIELAIGRYPVKRVALNGKTTVVNVWNDATLCFERLVSAIEKVIRKSESIHANPSDWLMIASRIAVLFGVFGVLLREEIIKASGKIDLSLPSGDMSALMAAWYARKMGLPIGTIICCCNENNGVWNLFHKGEIRTDAVAVQTQTPACDYAVPDDLERLIFAAFSNEEVLRFREIVRIGGIYCPDPELLDRMREGIHICVVGGKRLGTVIPNLYKTTGYIADPYTALSYSGLMDYRAATGMHTHALIIAEESPLFYLGFVSACMNMTPDELKLQLY